MMRWILALLLSGCAAPFEASTRRTWTHPTALYETRRDGITTAPPANPDAGNGALPFVEVYMETSGGAMNKARVWGWTEDEAARDARLVADALRGAR